jgi:glycosyltransferase involved in cell wall biosynthesis
LTGIADIPSIFVDGSLLLQPDQTGVASFTRSLTSALCRTGVKVTLLLGSAAHPRAGAPSIGLADQVFGRTLKRKGRLAQLAALWSVGFGLRRRLTALPVPVEGIDMAALAPPLPDHQAVYNANNFLAHSRLRFALRGQFTQIVLNQTASAMHWTAPVPVSVPGRPNIYTIHDLIPLKFPQFVIDTAGRAARLHGMIARKADHIITASERSRQDIIAILGVPAERISVAYQPVPPSPSMDRADAERLVSTVYSAEPGRYALFCGAIEPKKNLARLIEAFKTAGTGQQLLLVGPMGWLYKDVKEHLKRGPNAQVRYLGYLPRRHVVALMQCAGFFAFPSIYEGFGLPVLEAMQLGTPVLTSTAGSLPEVAGDAAVKVDALDVGAMTKAIRDLASDADLRQELSLRGFRQAQKFSVDAFVRQLALAYQQVGIDLLQGSRSP